MPANPWPHQSVVEPQREVAAQTHAAVQALDLAHDHRGIGSHRHEIGQANVIRVVFELSVEHQRIAAVSARLGGRYTGCDPPETIRLGSEQRRETGIAVEARQTEPVDRPARRYQRAGAAVADHRVIFNS